MTQSLVHVPATDRPANAAETGVSASAMATLNRLLQPAAKGRRLALADGGEVLSLPTADEVEPQWLARAVSKARSAEPLEELEQTLMRRREATRALAAAAQGASSSSTLHEALHQRARKADRLHFAHMRLALQKTRPLEIEAWQHFSFFAESRIPLASQLRGSIDVIALDAEGLLNHPCLGSPSFYCPLEGIANVHSDVVGLTVVSGEVSFNEEVVEFGLKAGDHSSLVYVSLPPWRLNSLDQVRKKKPGEENVVLTCLPLAVRRASVYEDDDVVVSGAFAAAGMEFYKMCVSQEFGLATPTTGCQSVWTFSDAYALYDEKGPLVIDFGKGLFDQLPEGVLVGASATNPQTEATSNFNIYGNHTAGAAVAENQIPTRFALNHLRRKLKIHGHRMLVDAGSRGAAIREVEGELRRELAGKAPKPFQSLSLVEDLDSDRGKQALARGGVLIRAEVQINSRTERVELIIVPLIPTAPQGA